jgi:nicotinate phosphoribosyltransferase
MPPEPQPGDRALQVAMVTKGEWVPGPTLDESREHLRSVLKTLPWEGLALSRGEPAIPTRYVEAG